MLVKFEVNGTAVEIDIGPRQSLADCLRETLHLTGTHLGCEHGVCGACTVIVGGEAMLQIYEAEQAAGIEQTIRLDTSRVIAGIVGGIGFLGAGAIFQGRGRVHGMTTASGIWMTAAVGVACGLGQFILAGIATALAFGVLVLLRQGSEEDGE